MAAHSDRLEHALSEGEASPVRQAAGLVGFLVLSFAAAGLGSLATMPSIPTWYAGLEKPFFTPPNEVFPIVWTILYAVMGIAAWLVWRKDAIRSDRKNALTAFAVQLALNVAWSFVFFGLHSTLGGVAVIVLLLIALLWTIGAFRVVSPPAAALMVPYLAWVTFATALNTGIYVLNG